MKAEDLPEILKMEDVAKYLRVSRSTAYELARHKDFPAIRIGERCVRVEKSSFLAWCKKAGVKEAMS